MLWRAQHQFDAGDSISAIFLFPVCCQMALKHRQALCCLETKLRPSFHKYKLNHVVPAQQTSRGVSLQGAANDTVGGKFSNMIPVPLSIYPQRFITIECNRFPIAKQTRSQKNASGACAPDTIALNCSPSRVGGPGVLPPEKV